MFNRDSSTHTFNATAQGRLRWVDISPTTFETTNLYGSGTAFSAPAGNSEGSWGWDFVSNPGVLADGGILAYSKYKIWVENQNHIYIDFRDTKYIAGNPNLDFDLFYDGNSWWVEKPGITDSIAVADGSTVGVWTIYGRSSPDQDDFKVPVTIETNFTGGEVKVNSIVYNSPYVNTTDYSQGSSFTISVDADQVDAGNFGWKFTGWSDNGAQTHSVSIPNLDNAINRTANFVQYPSTPQNLQLSTSAPNWYVDLTWDAVTDAGVSGYTVYRKIDNGNWSVKATTSSPSYTDTDIYVNGKPWQKVYYKVDAYTTWGGHSQQSNEVWTYFDHINFKRGVAQDSGSNTSELDPAAFSLLTNYPNPFNPETTIQYRLAENSRVSLVIYDHLGKEIINLINAVQSEGRHSIRWNARDRTGKRVSSGLYFYKMGPRVVLAV